MGSAAPPAEAPLVPIGREEGGGVTFQTLERKLRENAIVESTDLKSGRVPEQADVLFVVAPENIDKTQLFAIDQFL